MAGKVSSDTLRALRLVAKGMTAYAAAKRCKIALSTIYRAQRRIREQTEACSIQVTSPNNS